MKDLFGVNSPLMKGLGEATDMFILNIIALVCSIPIVTIGASSAGLYTAMNGLRKDEGTPVRNFFRGFRANFKQATILWLILLASALIQWYAISFYAANDLPGGGILLILQLFVFAVWAVVNSWAGLLQVKFENTLPNILRNSLLLGISFILRTLVMIVLDLIPVVLFLYFPGLFVQLGLIWVFFWWSLTQRVKLWLTDKPLKRVVGDLEAPKDEEEP